ncbi:MAG: IS66 family transposase [Polyangiaceae bacterium]
MVVLEHETNLETLRDAAKLLERENRKLLEKVLSLQSRVAELEGKAPADLQQRLALLETQLAQRNKMIFGASSEKRSRGEETHANAEKEPKKGHGPREQPALPLVEEAHDLDEPDKVCRACGGAMQEWAGQEEASEEIDVIERRFVIRRHLRKKYRCRCGGCVETAPGPMKLREGSRYSIDFAIEVAVDKYVDHLALERQARRMGRDGLVIDSQTLWDQINLLAHLLKPLRDRIHAWVLSQPVIGADETRWRLMSEKGKDEGPGKWHVWAIACPTAVSHSILDNRSATAAKKVFGDFAGTAMVDGYDVYESLRRLNPGLQLAHCWAHVRRKYVELEKTHPEATGEVLELIGRLYGLERGCATGPPGDRERARLREGESREVVRAIEAWALRTEALPQSAMGRAIRYMGNHWKGLLRFLEDPRVPLDNNATERALRGPVQGRKNHYGSRSVRGTEVAALFYTVLDTVILNGLDPREYLRAAVIAERTGETIPLPHELAAKADE